MQYATCISCICQYKSIKVICSGISAWILIFQKLAAAAGAATIIRTYTICSKKRAALQWRQQHYKKNSSILQWFGYEPYKLTQWHTHSHTFGGCCWSEFGELCIVSPKNKDVFIKFRLWCCILKMSIKFGWLSDSLNTIKSIWACACISSFFLFVRLAFKVIAFENIKSEIFKFSFRFWFDCIAFCSQINIRTIKFEYVFFFD